MLDIQSTLRPAPFLKGAGRIPFEKIASLVLGAQYELSLVVCGDSLSRRMNHTYRQTALGRRQAGKKNYAPNVLSFPLTAHEGEIFLNVRKAEREAKRFGVPLRERLALLFVHGCFHLKGLRHGRTMEGKERSILHSFSFTWHGNSTQE